MSCRRQDSFHKAALGAAASCSGKEFDSLTCFQLELEMSLGEPKIQEETVHLEALLCWAGEVNHSQF